MFAGWSHCICSPYRMIGSSFIFFDSYQPSSATLKYSSDAVLNFSHAITFSCNLCHPDKEPWFSLNRCTYWVNAMRYKLILLPLNEIWGKWNESCHHTSLISPESFSSHVAVWLDGFGSVKIWPWKKILHHFFCTLLPWCSSSNGFPSYPLGADVALYQIRNKTKWTQHVLKYQCRKYAGRRFVVMMMIASVPTAVWRLSCPCAIFCSSCGHFLKIKYW